MKQKIKIKLKQFWHIYGTPKMLVSFGIAWLITNGWSYVFIVIGPMFNMSWMFKIGIAWQGILWFPLTIEKPITFAIALWLHRLLFKEEISKEEK